MKVGRVGSCICTGKWLDDESIEADRLVVAPILEEMRSGSEAAGTCYCCCKFWEEERVVIF